MRDSRKNFQIIQSFPEKNHGTDPASFPGICMEDFAAVEDIVQTDIFLYDIDIVNGSLTGELPRRNEGNYSNFVPL